MDVEGCNISGERGQDGGGDDDDGDDGGDDWTGCNISGERGQEDGKVGRGRTRRRDLRREQACLGL